MEDITEKSLQERNLRLLKNGVSIFRYKKGDGSIRLAAGTLNQVCIPVVRSMEAPAEAPRSKTVRTDNPTVQSYYDLQVQGWRTYTIDSLLEILEK